MYVHEGEYAKQSSHDMPEKKDLGLSRNRHINIFLSVFFFFPSLDLGELGMGTIKASS